MWYPEPIHLLWYINIKYMIKVLPVDSEGSPSRLTQIERGRRWIRPWFWLQLNRAPEWSNYFRLLPWLAFSQPLFLSLMQNDYLKLTLRTRPRLVTFKIYNSILLELGHDSYLFFFGYKTRICFYNTLWRLQMGTFEQCLVIIY